MADWFKFFNDSIDEPRLQWAISEQPEVLPVWVLILSEASKHYQDTITWRDKDYELMGYARKINISAPKFNCSLGLLERIEYIEKGEGYIKVLKWNDMQSEYCQKKAKKCPDSVPIVSRQCPDSVALEERRVEEIKRGIPHFSGNGNGKSNGRLAISELIVREKELMRVEKALRELRSNHVGAWEAKDKDELKRLKDRRKELIDLLGMAV